MKGTLVKREDRYDLYNESDGSKIASSAPNPQGKLSIENCMSIENGYDINQLAIEVYRDFPNKANGDETLPMWGKDEHATKKRKAFIKGFKTAVEILGDKKFSEEDVIKCMKNSYGIKYFSEHKMIENLKSLQQTEWDVVVVMDRIPADLAPGGWDVFPKLDADGCLILKRVE